MYEQLNTLYKVHLGREIDYAGLNHYGKLLKSKMMNLHHIELDLKNSKEYKIRDTERRIHNFKLSQTNLITTDIQTQTEYVVSNAETQTFIYKKDFAIQTESISKNVSTEIDTSIQNLYKKEIGIGTENDSKISLEIQVDYENDSREIINVFLCCRNNSETIDNTFESFRKMQKDRFNYNFVFYIYENDSEDDTPFKIINFFKKNWGSYSIQCHNTKLWHQNRCTERIQNMVTYRNKNKDMCTNWENSKYSLIFDTNILFTSDVVCKMIKELENNSNIAMVTPYGICSKYKQYYDTYALETMFHTNKLHPFKEKTEVLSAFSGLVVLRTHALKDSKWSVPDNCILKNEHNPFCKEIRRFGKIIILKEAVVYWLK